MLQIENELYAPIRPKRVTKSAETPSEALADRGIEYIEIRSLDVNPFALTGITTEQMSVLDSLLVWMALQPSAPMTSEEMLTCRSNTTKVVKEGRKPGLTLTIDGSERVLVDVVNYVLAETQQVAALLDQAQTAAGAEPSHFSAAVAEQQELVQTPEQLLSSKVLANMQADNIEHSDFILGLANDYKTQLIDSDYEHWNEAYFTEMQNLSFAEQQGIEDSDTLSFDDFLADYFSQQA